MNQITFELMKPAYKFYRYEMTDLIILAIRERADRLSLYVGQSPVIEVRGEEHSIEGAALTLENAMSLFRQVADTRQMRELHELGIVGFVYIVPHKAKFRVQARLVRDEMQVELHRVLGRKL